MAGQKPAARRSASARQAGTKQGPVRPGSPTARPAADSKRQTQAKSNTGTSRPDAARSASAGGPGNQGAQSKSRTGGSAANAATAPKTNAAATLATQLAGGPVGRLLRAAWSPFGSMGALPLATLLLSLYGLGASIYLTLTHFDSHITLACSDKGAINCEAVTTSPESMVFGIFPVAVLGLAFYVFMVAVNSPWAWRLTWPAVRWLRLGSVIAGMGFVLYLIFAEIDEIHAICLWCTSVHVATFLIFALLIFYSAFTWENLAAPGGRRVL